MIIDREDISKASFRRVNSKTLDHLFLSQVEKGAKHILPRPKIGQD